MTPKDQVKLFRKVIARFPKWSERKCSGYVHGIVDETRRVRPRNRQVKAFRPGRVYAIGYVLGFIDARGEDAFNDPRLASMKRRSNHSFDYSWWEDAK